MGWASSAGHITIFRLPINLLARCTLAMDWFSSNLFQVDYAQIHPLYCIFLVRYLTVIVNWLCAPETAIIETSFVCRNCYLL
ncbi:hypothetical protein HMPREF3166_03700 [Corynebacterium sp. HMSC08A12]|nr:hypothetical protein HMPREF3166_03700 [Corynebacterium sp. HMSC08A12]